MKITKLAELQLKHPRYKSHPYICIKCSDDEVEKGGWTDYGYGLDIHYTTYKCNACGHEESKQYFGLGNGWTKLDRRVVIDWEKTTKLEHKAPELKKEVDKLKRENRKLKKLLKEKSNET